MELIIIKFKIDDVVGAIPVHGFAGIWGTLAVPLTILVLILVLSSWNLMDNIFVFVVAFIVWYLMKINFGIRISEEAESLELIKQKLE